MLIEILVLVGLTLLPFLELRASIPYGILSTDIHWGFVFLICVVSNVLLGPVIYVFLGKAMNVFTRVKAIDRAYQKYMVKAQNRIHPYVEKYGELGVALFIGVPLPGSGVYSGALGSYVLGLSFRKFCWAPGCSLRIKYLNFYWKHRMQHWLKVIGT